MMIRHVSALFVLPFLLAAPASAQVFVQGGGAAHSCYQSVLNGNQGSVGAIRTCTEALSDTLVRTDIAATHVNRGVLHMRGENHDMAVRDYEAALRIRPELAEAHINLAAALYYRGEDKAALEAVNRAIDLETGKMAEALFNRALIHDRMGDARSAYYDLKKALSLKPDWEAAEKALSRYTVTRRASRAP